MTDARLGFIIDSSQAENAVADLDSLTNSSARAEKSADELRAAYIQYTKTMQDAAVATQRTSTGQSQAASVTEQASTRQISVIGRVAAAWERLISTFNRTQTASAKASASIEQVATNSAKAAGSIKFNTANIAAQFQDIGVTAAMGMNPLNIALQQGTQLASVLAMMENPLKGIGEGLRSIFGPTMLLTIGIVALVAAGLEMVKWAQVAKTVLNAVADSLVTIAPYAALAAGGLALLYAPKIIGGIVTLILNLGNIAKAVWGIAAAIYGTIGLPVLLIAGFVALVAAAVVWRKDLEKALGVDIVGVVQKSVNWIIGTFVGAYKGIVDTWNALPKAMGDLVYQAADGVVKGIQDMINSVIRLINDLTNKFALWRSSIGRPLTPQEFNGMIMGPVNLQGPTNPFAGAASKVGSTIGADMQAAQGYDYVGAGIKKVQDLASGAAAQLHKLADSIGVNTKAGKKAAEQYASIVRGAQQRIDASKIEIANIGKTTEEINSQLYAQDLLNKAANDHLKLTQAQKDNLVALGHQMAATEAAAKALTDAYNFSKDVFQGIFADFKTNLENGESWFQAFADAGVNALNKILDKAIEVATSKVFDNLFNLSGGGSSGGWLSSVLGFFGLGGGTPTVTASAAQAWAGYAKGDVFTNGISGHSNSVVTRPTLFKFASGAGLMGEAGPEAIMPLKRGPDGKLGVSGAGGGNPVDVRVGVTVDDNGGLQAYVKSVSQRSVRDGISQYDAAQPAKVHRKAIKAINNPTAPINQW